MWMIDNYCTKSAVIVLFQRAGGKPIKEKRLFGDKWRSLRLSSRDEKPAEQRQVEEIKVFTIRTNKMITK